MSTETTIRPALDWQSGGEFEDIRYELSADGIAKVTIDRPEVRNAFRPQTLIEVGRALEAAREDPSVGVIILTGQGDLAFCSGGDQRVRGDTGYLTDPGSSEPQVGRFHVTDLQVQMRRLPKPIVAMVAGYALGGGHVLHLGYPESGQEALQLRLNFQKILHCLKLSDRCRKLPAPQSAPRANSVCMLPSVPY